MIMWWSICTWCVHDSKVYAQCCISFLIMMLSFCVYVSVWAAQDSSRWPVQGTGRSTECSVIVTTSRFLPRYLPPSVHILYMSYLFTSLQWWSWSSCQGVSQAWREGAVGYIWPEVDRCVFNLVGGEPMFGPPTTYIVPGAHGKQYWLMEEFKLCHVIGQYWASDALSNPQVHHRVHVHLLSTYTPTEYMYMYIYWVHIHLLSMCTPTEYVYIHLLNTCTCTSTEYIYTYWVSVEPLSRITKSLRTQAAFLDMICFKF